MNKGTKKKYIKTKLNEGVTNYYGFSNASRNKYNIPVFAKFGESLEFIGGHSNGRATHFKGMFLPIIIEHGEEFDVLRGKFGLTQVQRDIIVRHNHARRQLLTVKIGQWCEVFGEARLYRKEVTLPDGKVQHPLYWGLFAMAINGWYVPRMFDVKKHEEDVAMGNEKPWKELNEERTTYFNNIIEDVFKERIDVRTDEVEELYETDINMGE